jgi:hypothetical protein
MTKKKKVTSLLRFVGETKKRGLAFESQLKEEFPGGGFHENNIAIDERPDGAIILAETDSEVFIYLYPEQVKHLQRILSGNTLSLQKAKVTK